MKPGRNARADQLSSGKWLLRTLAVAWGLYAAFFEADAATALVFSGLSLLLLVLSELGLDLLV